MVEKDTLARPYAKAIFEIALKNKDFEKWSLILNALALTSENKEVIKILSNYTISPNEMADFFIDVCEKALDDYGKNLVKILAHRRRLNILPEISKLYEEMKNKAENIVKVDCVSAIPLKESQKNSFAAILEKNFKKKVVMECQVDPSLLGGFVLRAGDKVIDGSIMSQLVQLKETMGG